LNKEAEGETSRSLRKDHQGNQKITREVCQGVGENPNLEMGELMGKLFSELQKKRNAVPGGENRGCNGDERG